VDEVDASSSTIRAELSHLECVGLLDQPHTSSGRVPTDRGYRYYVDAVMEEGSGDETPFETPEGYGNVDELCGASLRG
jgi:heat-inducible transcriptional repressor